MSDRSVALKIVEEAIAIQSEEHPVSYMRGGPDEHFCDSWECDWESDRDARFDRVVKVGLPLIRTALRGSNG